MPRFSWLITDTSWSLGPAKNGYELLVFMDKGPAVTLCLEIFEKHKQPLAEVVPRPGTGLFWALVCGHFSLLLSFGVLFTAKLVHGLGNANSRHEHLYINRV